MTRGEFERLTERYRLGECTPEEIAFIEKWVELNSNPDGDDSIFESEAEMLATAADLWAKIRIEAKLSRQHRSTGNRIALLFGAAACIVLLLVIFSPGDRLKGKSPEPAMTGIETHNTSVTQQRIILPDSSVVTLAEGARIITSEDYGQDKRVVRLIGEAFFQIRPNPKLPFLVYSGDLVTEVLGTTFSIRPEAGKKTIEVSVMTGKVSVYTSEPDQNKRRNGVILTPNQKVVYDTEHKTIKQDLVAEPKMVIPQLPEYLFEFDEARVKSVLSRLERAYGMEIIVNNPELNDCEFTGNLNGYDLFKQLSFICDVIDAQYEVRGGTIFLTGGGGCIPAP